MKFTSTSHRTPRKCGRGFKRSLDDEEGDRSDHSSDSGLGYDHPSESRGRNRSFACNFEEESNAEYCFPSMPGRGRCPAVSPVNLSTPLAATSRDGRAVLAIVNQPEQQHRARYQTEGSRGAVKDRTGNGFPIVKLSGYNKPTTLQIFVGTDVGRVAPHMFYQACRVSGKNSTPCMERKIDGTVVIEVDLDPSKDMIVTCDCVGILKERNVDVEHRFPDQTAARNKKKSTRCRMVFRASIVNSDGTTEILQVCSQPIVCTQPPGIPEICKKSLTSCPVTGGLELFILGKNFLKDTQVVFQSSDMHPHWEESVMPDKEFLQQNHLVCVVPPYKALDIAEPVSVKVFVTSSGKSSDPHSMVYVPVASHHGQTPMDTQPCSSFLSGLASSTAFVNGNRGLAKACNVIPAAVHMETNYFEAVKKDSTSPIWPSATKPEPCEGDESMLPPPPDLIPLARRTSFQLVLGDREEFKAEAMDDMSQNSMSCDREASLSPSDMQCVDLSMKPPLMRHMIDPSLGTQFLKTETTQFPTVYENEPQFLEDTLLRPPPNKILARSFGDGSSFVQNSEGICDSQSPGFASVRGRSGSFSHSSIHDNSMTGFENLSRVRSASMSSQNFDRSAFFPQVPPISFPNNCSLNDVENAMSNVVKQAAQSMQSSFFNVTPSAAVVVTGNLTPPVMDSMVASTPNSTRAIDAIVNSAVESHIASAHTSSPPTFAQPLAVPSELAMVAEEVPAYVAAPFPVTTSMETNAVPVTVTEISQTHNVGEMVKMTDHDLISYINPSCFDQGIIDRLVVGFR